MHRLEDVETGERINPYGATIRLGRHVWLGREAIVTGHVEIGEGAVVGSRSMVRGQKVPPHTAVAGTPARVIREGVTWRGEDTP
jgi:acetyltransferase-like isoleucine patch superfamily enzyme